MNMQEEKTTIDPNTQKLLTVPGFIDKFWEMLNEYPGNMEGAYNAVERLYQGTFGKRKYANYNSFRVNMSNYLKRKKDGEN
jgi:hypothetical protein